MTAISALRTTLTARFVEQGVAKTRMRMTSRRRCFYSFSVSLFRCSSMSVEGGRRGGEERKRREQRMVGPRPNNRQAEGAWALSRLLGIPQGMIGRCFGNENMLV